MDLTLVSLLLTNRAARATGSPYFVIFCAVKWFDDLLLILDRHASRSQKWMKIRV